MPHALDIVHTSTHILDDVQYAGSPQELEQAEIPHAIGDELSMQDVKISSSHNESSRRNSLHSEQAIDNASVHSLPVAHVTDPEPPTNRRPSTARGAESSVPPRSLSSLSRSQTSQEGMPMPESHRRLRHRSGAEPRSSNRLSGFFTNLIHRRDHPTNSTIHEDAPPSTPRETSETQSRPSSPIPARPVTPPPPLPPPTLSELGLSLSALTSDLSPSHFSTPPSSGAFLAPHYLLLCHAQGLDVLPLVYPPAPQPYALVRRVCFKSVVVMEHRGVLVAIAGRRDGVRVYALEEVKRAIEWRIDVEVRRERDRIRRETVKKIVIDSLENGHDSRNSTEKPGKASLSTPPPGEPVIRNALLRRGSYGPFPISSPPPPPSAPIAPLIPRSPTPRVTRRPKVLQSQVQVPTPAEHPPPYSNPSELTDPPRFRTQPSTASLAPRSRRGSVSDVLAAAPSRRNLDGNRVRDPDLKSDWVESSDDEAIDIVAAASSGSQALDERTSVNVSAAAPAVSVHPVPVLSSTTSTSTRRRRPSNLDLTFSRTSMSAAPPEPSPVPTLLTLRQALSNSPPTLRNIHTMDVMQDPDTPVTDDDDGDVNGRISLAQALFESRIPDLPPAGTRRPQEPILITSSHPVATADDEQASNRTSEEPLLPGPSSNNDRPGRRGRWSVLLGSTTVPSASEPLMSSRSLSTSIAPAVREHPITRSNLSRTSTVRPSTSPNESSLTRPLTAGVPGQPEATPSIMSPRTALPSRFIPRLITNAFNGRRSDDRPFLPIQKTVDSDSSKKDTGTPLVPHAPPPKLEYVKLPGTKGALVVKAVETAKKSFLAILCGENGEKVELFAGTYRTALGLSRTFILPDSPRSLELQLQGDDLVEVFLVFSQNVFGLEPATVRVREVRIGRAERRAARRRAREIRSGETPNDSEAALAEEDLNVNVNIGVSVAGSSTATGNGDRLERSQTPPLIPNEHPDAQPDLTPSEAPATSSVANSEELVAVARMGPYTTFQQLSFAPKFPLASIADEYIIPPTYPSFLEYRATHEPEEGNNTDLAQVQFSPPGLPVPVPTAPSRWFYRDPKNVVHGPWKASLMQAWYKDGLLPPDLPVRREEDDEYMLLKEVRLQCVDPTHPFRCPPTPIASTPMPAASFAEGDKPLLPPISLLSQPRHFGPPALFFSSRGGHSTAIVDARGRSVLKGRFFWSPDEMDEESKPAAMVRMGDVKRLEAFDVHDRAVLVAMRRGGLEAVDLSDALLKPADESRTVLPQFSSSHANTNRRAPFVWKIGTPVSSSPTSATILSSKGKGGHGSLGTKKPSSGSTKSPSGRTEFSVGDVESDTHDEVFFLGRKDNEIYFCERNAGFFRILRLCPDSLQ